MKEFIFGVKLIFDFELKLMFQDAFKLNKKCIELYN